MKTTWSSYYDYMMDMRIEFVQITKRHKGKKFCVQSVCPAELKADEPALAMYLDHLRARLSSQIEAYDL